MQKMATMAKRLAAEGRDWDTILPNPPFWRIPCYQSKGVHAPPEAPPLSLPRDLGKGSLLLSAAAETVHHAAGLESSAGPE